MWPLVLKAPCGAGAYIKLSCRMIVSITAPSKGLFDKKPIRSSVLRSDRNAITWAICEIVSVVNTIRLPVRMICSPVAIAHRKRRSLRSLFRA
jgi:hypothetical protein